ncbi:phosphoribosylaminoimidazole carboxylase ATPase subunit [Streptococcus pneumoniae]|nr:phosphoribosylaminoimidazole carboxylase ATPase subunit [Streptococcus pneumoniae]VLQ32168.1 phosphoribosylaminoimidazole carboxylase ATPase subunit [Streptococcus pneumoniae]VPC01365.1 phosphoribosylaminoimidazole carboxylase ATPase subunit [Streptococcus pneumoniae]
MIQIIVNTFIEKDKTGAVVEVCCMPVLTKIRYKLNMKN